MRLVRWQPFAEVESLRNQMDRMFDEIAGVNRPSSQDWTPAIEIQDREDSLVLRAEIPGVEAKDLDIQVAREAVAISGEHCYENKAQQGFFRTELRYGSFQRTIPLPVAVENTFHEHLEQQLRMLELESEEEEAIAQQLIGSIDDDGYLRR
ncbi:Hsp20 family protein, partial [Nostoc sp.]|uniref:Hsp20/alpha crystallin family protein n=1 Tax=Nostoc sp. TaxID=1180 RepID=UPI0035948816